MRADEKLSRGGFQTGFSNVNVQIRHTEGDPFIDIRVQATDGLWKKNIRIPIREETTDFDNWFISD